MPGESGALWYDDEAGPMVRPYTVTRGRTTASCSTPQMDVIALVSLRNDGSDPGVPDRNSSDDVTDGSEAFERIPSGDGKAGPLARPVAPPSLRSGRVAGEALGDDHLALLDRCRPGPLSVADLAVETNLPLGVVRVLLADLLNFGRVRVTKPVPPAELPDIGMLQHLITGLRSL